MMNPNPFNDDLQESGIPMFGKNGTALSQKERAAIAHRRGLCLKCGTKTHQVKIMGRTPLTNDDVYQGTCIKCNNGAVPAQILQAWQSRNAPSQPGSRLRSAAQAVRYVARPGHPAPGHQRRPNSGGSGVINAVVTPAGLTRKGSRTSYDPNRSASQLDTSMSSRAQSTRGGFDPNRSQSSLNSSHHTLGNSQHAVLGNSQHVAPQEDYKTNPGADVATLLKDIRENRDKPDVLRAKLHGLRNLGNAQTDALSVITEVMGMHKNDVRLMRLAAGAVWGIASKSDEMKLEAAETGCLTMLIDMIRNGTTKDDEEAVYWALGAIACLVQLDGNKRVVAGQGGTQAIVDALSRHDGEPEVFEWAARALHSMITSSTEDKNVTYELEMASIESANGIKALNSAMKTHFKENLAVGWCLKALYQLQDRADPAASSGVIKMMNDESVADTCIKVIKSRTADANTIVQAQELLVLLLSASANQVSLLGAAECIPASARILSDNQSNDKVFESVARFFACAVRDNFQAKLQVAETKGVRPILQRMISNPTDLSLQRAGFDLLWTLSADESSFDYALISDAKIAIDSAAGEHSEDAQLMECICGYIANIAPRVSGKTENIPIDLVLRLSTGRGTPNKQAGRALSAVCAAFPNVAEKLVNDGTCERMLEGLCDTDIGVQTSSCSMIVAMASQSDIAREKVFQGGGLTTVSAALYTTTSEALAESLLILLSTLVSVSDKKAIQLPVELIQAILHAASTFPGVKKLAFSTIRNTMLVSVPGFALSTDGLLDMTLAVFDDPSSRDDLVIEAAGAFWACTAKQPLTTTNDISRAFKSLLTLCAKHRGEGTQYNGPVLTEAAGAFSSLMHCLRDNPINIPDPDIDLIISILDIVIECDVENVVLMDRFMDVILTLCFLSKEILIQFGVIVVVIDCMVEHEAIEMIQQKGCAILALLASTENLQVNLSIAETDGIDMIVSALAGFSENIQIQTDACRALSHLSIDHESRMLIASQGGLILLVNAMGKYRDESDLLEAACAALLNLSSDAEEQILAGSNVIETIVATMKYQVNFPRIQEKCLGVLQNISMRSKDSKRNIADAGGVGAVIFCMNEFMGSPAVLERAFTTLWSLAVLESNQQVIANDGGVSLVINGMMANITFEKVQKQACGCLCTLSSNSENKTLIRDLGGVDAIVYAMWAHYNSDALLVEACRALSSLAVNVQTNEVMIASEGEISAIMSALKRFPNSERLQEHGCVVLRNFLLSADNAAIVRPQAVELEELMNLASTKFPDRCADRARQVLASIQ